MSMFASAWSNRNAQVVQPSFGETLSAVSGADLLSYVPTCMVTSIAMNQIMVPPPRNLHIAMAASVGATAGLAFCVQAAQSRLTHETWKRSMSYTIEKEMYSFATNQLGYSKNQLVKELGMEVAKEIVEA